MSCSTCIDLVHPGAGLEGAMAAYLIDADEPTLVDPGPTPTLDHLTAELGGLGVGADDLRHVLLTHIHLDHAGATGHLVERFPRAVVHVHEDGAPHMIDPEKLVASTRRTFGAAHDRLWGETKPVPAERVRAWRPGEPGPWRGLRPLATPGHIQHHVAFLDERDGTLFAGDAMGNVLSEGAPPLPPTPPPAVNLRAWHRTLESIGSVGPERFGAAHFGFRADVEACRSELARRLDALEERVRRALAEGNEADAAAYESDVRSELASHMGEQRAAQYLGLFSAANDWAGVAFYLTRNP
ncbi:MAG TPA: MBL fold metallo-hydrolase [Longimicrobiales bacterium]|nr:MBL fold metallo-hydrolase [Longimicrobiales bacterium]